MNKGMMVIAIVLGLVFIYVGYIYASHSAGSLPGYFPGFESGSTHIHTKHSIAAFLLGIACFVYAWFKSAPRAQS